MKPLSQDKNEQKIEDNADCNNGVHEPLDPLICRVIVPLVWVGPTATWLESAAQGLTEPMACDKLPSLGRTIWRGGRVV